MDEELSDLGMETELDPTQLLEVNKIPEHNLSIIVADQEELSRVVAIIGVKPEILEACKRFVWVELKFLVYLLHASNGNFYNYVTKLIVVTESFVLLH